MRNVTSLTAAMLAIGLSVVQAQTPPASDGKSVTVYKQVGCGCCSIWAEQLRKLGFKVSTMEIADLARIKNTYGVPAATHTCHTALVDGYVFEGHVPLDLVQKVLKERPKIAGLAVPQGRVRRPRIRPRRQDERVRQAVEANKRSRTRDQENRRPPRTIRRRRCAPGGLRSRPSRRIATPPPELLNSVRVS
jgi:hypothetical protein